MKKQIANQFRKPSGFWGRLVARFMRKFNRPFFEKLIQQLKISDDDKILEIGYGPGDAIKLVAEQNTNCMITGIDFSELMYAQALKNNNNLIQDGRLDLHYGDFLIYSFGEKKFTKVFCVNVIYFWDDLLAAFLKVYNTLEPNGIYAIYMASAEDLMKIPFARDDVFNKHSINHVKTCLREAGFSNIEVNSYAGKKEHGYFIFAQKK